MSKNWTTTKANIRKFLRSNPGKMLSDINAKGVLIFNPADYCPYADECLSFNNHSRGSTGSKGVHSHLRKVHPDVIQFLLPCTPKELKRYEKEDPGSITNILDGMQSGRLKFCPSESTPEKRASLEKKLRTLYAVKRQKNHCKTFLDDAIPRSSRNINRDDIQGLLSGLGDVWSRGGPSEISASGKGDAMRARMHAVSSLMNESEVETNLATISSKVPALRIPA